jgi:hypothetical protein
VLGEGRLEPFGEVEQAAVDEQGLPGDVACVVAGQKGDAARDVLWLGDEAGRRACLDSIDDLRSKPVMLACGSRPVRRR